MLEGAFYSFNTLYPNNFIDFTWFGHVYGAYLRVFDTSNKIECILFHGSYQLFVEVLICCICK